MNESELYRVNQSSMSYYDKRFNTQVNNTGGRVDTSSRRLTSSELYDKQYNQTLKTANRQKSIVDRDPRAAFKDPKTGKITKRFFRSSDLYVIPTGSDGTGDRSFYNSIKEGSYTTAIKRSAEIGGPIRLPNLPMSRQLGNGATTGYLQCMTKGHKIQNKGYVQLASAPKDIQDSTSAEIASDNAIGSAQSFELFSSMGSRNVSFSFDVYADYLPDPFNNVKEYCLALKSMCYPTYASLQVNSPDVIFEYGGIRIRGIPQINFTYSNTTKKGIIDKATVSVQITETESILDGQAKI